MIKREFFLISCLVAAFYFLSIAITSLKVFGYEVANVEEVVIPSQYKNEPNVPIYLVGSFSNTCQSFDKITVERRRGQFNLLAEVKTDELREEDCIETKVPFTKLIKLENVPYGSHRILVARDDNAPLELFVNRDAPNKYESFLVSDSDWKYREEIVEGETLEIVLKGMFTNSCFKKDYSDVIHFDNIIMIYPNSIRYTDNVFCSESLIPYIEKVEVKGLKAGYYQIWLMSDELSYEKSFNLNVRRGS